MLGKAFIFTALLIPSLSVNAALYDRGNGLIYDDVLDVTWTQNGNLPQTLGYGNTGLMNWQDAMDWAEQLVYGGFEDWRLPSIRSSSCVTYCHPTDGEIYSLLNLTLGNHQATGFPNLSFLDAVSGVETSFTNLAPNEFLFWHKERVPNTSDQAWATFENGDQTMLTDAA